MLKCLSLDEELHVHHRNHCIHTLTSTKHHTLLLFTVNNIYDTDTEELER